MNKVKIPGGKELINAQKLLKEAGISQGMKIADLGCGQRGFFSLQSAKLVGSKGIVYAIDILQSALNGLNSLANLFGISNLKTIWGDLEMIKGIDLPDESIDLALLNNVLFQTKNHQVIFTEATRILKKGGKLLVTEWEKTAIPFGPDPQKRIAKEEVKKLAAQAGLSLEKEIKAGPYHYSMVFTK